MVVSEQGYRRKDLPADVPASGAGRYILGKEHSMEAAIAAIIVVYALWFGYAIREVIRRESEESV